VEPSTTAKSVSTRRIADSIVILRGQKVLIDADLAMLYGVTTTRLNQQVQRNVERFPADFMFQLSAKEHAVLILQNATSKLGRGGRRKLPFVYTEHGAIQAANVCECHPAPSTEFPRRLTSGHAIRADTSCRLADPVR